MPNVRNRIRDNQAAKVATDDLKIMHVFSLVEYMKTFKEQFDSWQVPFDQQLATMFPLPVKQGSFRACVVFDDFVLKFDKNPDRSNKLALETQYIEKMRKDPKVARHFPETFMIGDKIQYQERCNPNYNLYNKYADYVERLASKLGVDDAHESNVGWRHEKNGPVPVFIDVDFRKNPKKIGKNKIRSWMNV